MVKSDGEDGDTRTESYDKSSVVEDKFNELEKEDISIKPSNKSLTCTLQKQQRSFSIEEMADLKLEILHLLWLLNAVGQMVRSLNGCRVTNQIMRYIQNVIIFSPRYMRCTINQIPCTSDLLNTSGIQLALLVQPFDLYVLIN
ncbi:unnamed protein product [Lactuca virosa]|uniref:Uncharacterized protein n=1 Tax=Lactuca virosa TaxID=75947 RepID=A0AAU9PK69_9ASTR|nr:unnamed protein product [Lactuca virosa]